MSNAATKITWPGNTGNIIYKTLPIKIKGMLKSA